MQVGGRERCHYRFEAKTVGGFVQQVAVSSVAHGYWWYVTGTIPEGKDSARVDLKLSEKYRTWASSAERARRKRAGWANVRYLRYDRFFILMATTGKQRFFAEMPDGESERDALGREERIRDIRRQPLRFEGYSISLRRGHPSVRIQLEEYLRLKAYFLDLAPRRRAEALVREFWRVPFESYAPVREQMRCILRAVNRARKTAGFEPVPLEAVRYQRRVYRPFLDLVDQPWFKGEPLRAGKEAA